MTSRNSFKFHNVLLYALGGLVLYQQYCIYELQVQVSSLQDHFKLSILEAGVQDNYPAHLKTAKSPQGAIDPLYHKSPPPQIPIFRLFPNDTRSLGGKQQQGKEIYGGVGDEIHLGGFTDVDNQTVSHNLWNFMLSELAVKSVIDIGCGRGISTNYFRERGAKVLCVEGSHDAIKHSYLPKSDIVQHDYSKGPWWPEETFDVAWSTELVEHIGRQYHPNYFATMKKAAIVIITSSMWGGYHHVEVHHHYWWISRMIANGFIYSKELTDFLRSQVLVRLRDDTGYVLGGMIAFINPSVASLPQHRHLFGGNGCYNEVYDNQDGGVPCMGVDTLPLEYQSLINCNKYYVTGENWSEYEWACKPNPNLAKVNVEKKTAF